MNNKLIAEFLNLDYDDETDSVRVLGTTYFQPAQYHRSWDWLMEVCKVLYDTLLKGDNEGGESYILAYSLTSMDISQVYDTVIELINEYNKNKQQ